MSKTILRDQRIFLDGYELTTMSNSISIEATKDTPDATSFGEEWRARLSGLKDFTFGCGGFMEIGDTEEYLFDELESTGFVLTVTPETQTVGGIAYNMKAIESSLSLFGNIGDAAPFQIGAAGNSIMGKGHLLAIPGTALTASGTSTAVTAAEAADGKKLKMSLHVLSASGTNPTLSVKLQSDTTGFSSPTDLITSATYSDIGAEYDEIELSSADTLFRLSYTLGGTNPSFTALCAISII